MRLAKGARTAFIAAVLSMGVVSSSLAEDYEHANRLYADGKFSESRTALEALGPAASPESNYLLGLQYIQGLGGRKRPSEGIERIKRAAEDGLPVAQFYLADAYFTSGRRYVDEDAANRYLQESSDAGHEQAKALLLVRTPNQPAAAAEAEEVTPATTQQGPSSKDEALLDCIATGKCEGEQAGNEPGQPGQGSRSTDPDPVVARPTKTGTNLGMILLLGAAGIIALLYVLFFVGTRCPRCKKIRSSEVLSRERTGQFVTTRTQTVRSTTTHRDSRHRQTGASETSRQVPVTVTIREFDEHRRCRLCGHEFIKAVRQEAR